MVGLPVILLAFLAAPIFFYIWLSGKNRAGAFLGAIFYGLAPYHILDIFVRGNTGETVAFAILPLVFLAIDRYPKVLPIFYGLFILSHNIFAVIFTPIIFLYTILINPKRFVYLFIGLALAAFFWLPAIFESRYLNSAVFTAHIYKDNFPTFLQLIYSPWGFGPEVAKIGGLSPQIGILPFFSALAAIVVFFKHKGAFGFLGTICFVLGIFFALPASSFFWQHIDLLRNFQFPWRFTALSSFGSALLVFYLCAYVNRIVYFGLFIGFLIASWPLFKVLPAMSGEDISYFSYNQTANYHGEASTVWTAGDPDKLPSSRVEIISGEAKVEKLKRRSDLHEYSIAASSITEVLDRTIFFPGWKVEVDGLETPIQFQNNNYPGLISFTVPAGQHRVFVRFRRTKIRLLAELISIVSLSSFVLYIIIVKCRKN